MNKENYLQIIAALLIVLVLGIPFYTTSVYASINGVSAKGSDGIEGFARAADFLNFNVLASISGDAITNEQVVLGSGLQFDKCASSIGNGSECTLRFPGNGTESFDAKSMPFTVSLFKDDKTLDDQKSGSITIDSKAPQVKLGSLPKFSSQQNVVVEYNATDFACDDPSCSNKCVGIKKIEFYTSDGAFRQSTEPTANDCSVKSSISIDPKTFNDGKNSVFAKAADKFDQESPEASVTFEVDSTGPSIEADSFAITRKGISLSAFSSAGIDADVTISISGNDLNLNSVTADLSALNPATGLKNAKASCASAEDGVSICKWHIELNPKTGGLKTIAVNASDTSGNKVSTAINKFLSVDEKGPAVKSLSTAAATAEGQFLAKSSGNTITAVFDEATGLSADEVFLHIGSSKIKASSCSKETDWACVWENVNFNSDQISVEADTSDILGNGISEASYVGITLDSQSPVLRSINISPVGGISQAFPGFFKIGDKISVVANITEDNDVFATADFSKFISGASKVAGSCERIQSDERMCTWLTDSVNLQASDAVTFNFSDNAGNALIVTKSLKTFGLENATVPDFWSNKVACSPATVDRGLGPLLNQRVYCQVSLSPKSATKAVSTVFIGPASCSGDTSVVQNVETFNTEVGSASPVIKLTLKKDDFRIDKADLSCSFNIFSKIGSGTDITKNPEIENAKISIEFFDLPLGELSAGVQSKIDEAKKETQGIGKLIGSLNKLMNVAKKICQIINVIYTSVVAMYILTGSLKELERACAASTGFLFSLGACGTVKVLADTQCFGTEGLIISADSTKKGVGWACDIVTCRQTFLWGNDVKKYIDNLPGARYVGPSADGKLSLFDYSSNTKIGAGGKPRPLSEYMDPQNSLVVASLFVCLPGIVSGLDKYRQIKCLYADCLQNAVGKEGLPVTACEDQKAYATCKYVTGELFAVVPYTALFDHFMKIIKNALSNPFGVMSIAVSISCGAKCPVPDSGWSYQLCRGARLLSLAGDAARNVQNIISEGFKVRQDYCSRIDNEG